MHIRVYMRSSAQGMNHVDARTLASKVLCWHRIKLQGGFMQRSPDVC